MTVSEFYPQRQLPGPIATILGRLHTGGFTERIGRRYVGGRWREIRMVQDVGEACLETHPQMLGDHEVLREPTRNGNGSRSLKNTDARISYASRTRRRRYERINVEPSDR